MEDINQDFPEKLSQLGILKKEKIILLCNDSGLQTGKKYEMIGRLLKFFENNLEMEDLYSSSQIELMEMCKGRDIPHDGSKETLIQRLYENVRGTKLLPKELQHLLSMNTDKNSVQNMYSEIIIDQKVVDTKSIVINNKTVNKHKRKKSESPEVTRKRRKLNYPISLNDFIQKAQHVNLKIDGNDYSVEPKLYNATNSFGWYATGRQTVVVDGESLEVAWNINMTVLGSK